MKRKSEFIVGLVTILALILLIVITLNIKKSVLFSKTYEIDVYFKQIKGLEVGAPVLVYGVIAGQVKEISYQSGDHPVLVKLRIKQKIKIYRNAIIRVTVAGLIGEARIEIDAGTPDAGKLIDSDDINGSPTMDLGQVIEMTPEIMRNMSDTIKSIKVIFEDSRNQKAISNSLINVESLTTKLNDMIGTDTQSLREIMLNLNRAVKNLDSLLVSTKGIVNDSRDNIVKSGENLNKLLVHTDARSEKFFKDLDETMQTTREILEKLDGVVVENKDKFSDIVTNLQKSSAKLDKTTEIIQNGDGTIGLLLKDPQPFYDLRDALVRIKEILGAEEKRRYEYDIDFKNSGKEKK